MIVVLIVYVIIVFLMMLFGNVLMNNKFVVFDLYDVDIEIYWCDYGCKWIWLNYFWLVGSIVIVGFYGVVVIVFVVSG